MDNELDLVVFEDDEGNEITMEVLDYFFYEGQEYALLADAEGECECGCGDDACEECEHERDAYIMKVVPVGDDQEEFVPVDEALADKLIDIVQNELYDDDEAYDDEEEEDGEDDEDEKDE